VAISFLYSACSNINRAISTGQTVMSMKQIGLALQSYCDTHKTLPQPKRVLENDGRTVELSWRVSLLPHIEQKDLFDRFDQALAWNHPANEAPRLSMPGVYVRVGRDAGEQNATFFQYFTGPETIWPDNQSRNLRHFPGGWSNTFLFAEALDGVPWTKPADMQVSADSPLPVPEDQFMICLGDASVRTILRSNVSDATLRLYINPRPGLPRPPLD
jgi:hypothetical protein